MYGARFFQDIDKQIKDLEYNRCVSTFCSEPRNMIARYSSEAWIPDRVLMSFHVFFPSLQYDTDHEPAGGEEYHPQDGRPEEDEAKDPCLQGRGGGAGGTLQVGVEE